MLDLTNNPFAYIFPTIAHDVLKFLELFESNSIEFENEFQVSKMGRNNCSSEKPNFAFLEKCALFCMN